MSNPYPRLLTLLRRAQLSLWRWRCQQAFRVGLCLAALLLMLLAMFHLLVQFVAPFWWLAVLPLVLLLSFLLASIFRWPRLSMSATELDRVGEHDGFFNAAREALQTAENNRAQGAQVLLQRAERTAAHIAVPVNWQRAESSYQRLALLSWVAVAVAVFLLQLPTAIPSPTTGQVGERAWSGAGDRVGTLPSRQVNPVVLPATAAVAGGAQMQAGGKDSAPRAIVAASLAAPGEIPAQARAIDEGVLDAASLGGGAVDIASNTAPAASKSTARRGSSTGQGAGAASGLTAPVGAAAEVRVEYLALERRQSPLGEVGGGADAQGLIVTDISAGTQPAAVALTGLESPVISYIQRFSASQRQLVKDYFERVQEQP